MTTGDESGGKIGRSYEESEEWWPERKKAPEGVPNVLLILLDEALREKRQALLFLNRRG